MPTYIEKIYRPHINYVGGKGWCVRELLNLIPAGITKIVSLFCGGMAFELNCAIRKYEVSAYDIDANLINYWTQWLTHATDIDYLAKQIIKGHTRDETDTTEKGQGDVR